MINETQRDSRCILILFLAVLFLSGCNTDTLEEQVAQAQIYHSQGHTEVAIIELKNILQKTPRSESALSELNRIYTEKRQYANIINLLFLPVKEGLANSGVLFSLTDALIHEARFQDAFFIINSHPDKFNTAQGLALAGHCFAGLNKTQEAKNYYYQALDLDANLVSAHLGLAQELIIFSEKHKKEQKHYQNTNDHDWVSSNNPVISARQDKFQQAKSHLQIALINDPENSVANYLSATISYLEKNVDDAQQFIERVLIVDPQHKESLLLMGKLHLEFSHLAEAEEFLTKYLEVVPDDLRASMYLASVKLRQNQPDQALELLEGFLNKGNKDPEYLLILGNVYLAKNNNDLAIDYFEKAQAIYRDSALVKMYSAMGYLARSDRQKKDRISAIQLLEEILQIEPKNHQAGITLTTTLLQENEYQKAENIATNMIKQFPRESLFWYLSGLAWQGMEQQAKAISAFEKTLILNHSFIPATIRLAKIYQEKNDYESAWKQYEAALITSPYNADIMTEMAIYEQSRGDNKKAVEILELARDRNPQALSPRLLLGTYYLRRGRMNIAQLILKELNKIAPQRPDVKMYFGQVQLATGRSSEAVTTFSKLIQIKPDSLDLLTKYAKALRVNGQIDASRKVINSVQELTGNSNLDALIELGQLELSERNYEEVSVIIERIKKDYADLSDGYILQGDLAMHQKKSQEAILSYQQATKINQTTAVVLKLYEAYRHSGKGNKAYALLENAVNKTPDDLRLGIKLANFKQQSGDMSNAIKIYLNLLEKNPDNALILNNLAWIYNKSDRKLALSYAERAYQITPELPQIIDSYGWFCVQEGRLREGLSLLETAVQKSPAEPEFRYHLAAALSKNGEKVSARKSLEFALESQEDFNGRNNAEKLLLELSRQDSTEIE